MANNNNFDCSSTNLLCNEETRGLNFDVHDEVQSLNNQNQIDVGSNAEQLIRLPCLSEECITWMLQKEKEHFGRNDYLNNYLNGVLEFRFRREAIDWMFKACNYYNFGESTLYTATTYFDRFLSVYQSPGDITWAIQLAAVVCLSLAAKIEEVNVPFTVDLQAVEPRFMFEGKTLQRMELMVLNKLKWEIKAYTPFNFLDYYLRKLNHGEFPSEKLITRSIQIILITIQGIQFLEFWPSEIAAAVATYVSSEIQVIDIDNVASTFMGVEKENVVKCFELIQDLLSSSYSSGSSSGSISSIITTAGNATSSSVSSGVNSPSGVLDDAIFSYKSDEKSVESSPTSPQSKRRKLD
ncbi:hypothetical protein ACJIZ3_023222 [Penstemon smallii]|uniref:Uncharacterized protein n=1 Tax=Penstemon smallii TaxID=265156 RepID=A0ABD3TPS2_9LAMI